MADENYEIDYPAIIAAMKKMLDEKFETEFEYFDLLKFVSEHVDNPNGSIGPIVNNLMSMSMSDQVIFLRSYKSMIMVCDTLQAKYNFEIPEDEDSEEY